MKARLVKLAAFILIMTIFFSGCGAPVFMSNERRFQEEPEIIQALQPYLDIWANQAPDDSRSQRTMIGRNLGIGIDILQWPYPDEFHSIPVLMIVVEQLGDWSRGYLYVASQIELIPNTENWELRRLDEYYYLYNYRY